MQAKIGRGFAIALRTAVAVLCASLLAGAPAAAQFWGGWGGWGRPQPAPQPPHRIPQPYNPFGNFFGPVPPSGTQRESPADYSHAPGPQKKPDSSAASTIAVVGDGMADWLAYGLEEA